MDPEDQDFRSRYSAETAGMPANLAAVASRNLAAADASTDRVNAAARATALPGVGASYSTPSTDMTNLDLGSAMDAGDRFNGGGNAPPVISGATSPESAGIDIGAVNARRNLILAGKDPDSPGLYVSDTPGRHGVSRRAELQHELGTLTDVLHEHSLETAARAKEDLVKQRSIEVANQATNIFTGLKGINPDGSPTSAAAVTKLIGDNRLGFDASPAVREEVARHAKAHDSAAAALTGNGRLAPEDKNYWANFGDAFKEASQVARKRGVDVQYDEQGFPSIAATSSVAPSGVKPPEKDVPPGVVHDYTKLQADKAEQQTHLKYAKDAGKTDIQKKIDILDSRIGVFHQQFPSLNPVGAGAADTAAATTDITPAPNDATKRQANAIYATPKGNLKWTGTGWVTP